MKLYKLPMIAGAVLMVGCAFAGDDQTNGDPAGTRAGWELALQLSDYHYDEPSLGVTIWGPRVGMSAAYTHTYTRNWFVRVDGRVSYGSFKYEGSGTQDGIPDLVFEVRGNVGRDFFPRPNISLSPYAGLGYRHLYNDLQGGTSTGHAGYRRYSEYFYIPLGLTTRFSGSGKWLVSPTIEYDYFISGTQESQLTDTGIPGYIDGKNKQRSGYGYRASVMLEKGAWAFGPWLHYWNIDDSDTISVGIENGMEPQNETREYGLEFKYRF